MPARARFDPAATRRAVVAGWRAVERLVDGVPDDAFDLPTRLGEWRVAELVGHLSRNPSHIARMLAGARAEPTVRVGAGDYYASTAPDPAIAARGVAEAADKPPAVLRAELHRLTDEAVELLDRLGDDQVLDTGTRSLTLADYLPSRCVEASVHSLDLAAATGLDPGLDGEALGVAVRLLATTLAARVPGRSVELRIPPYIAVQCVEGPRHTRGTPANVVELAGPVWLELATGRLAWADAVASGRVSASGERADLSAYLPVMA